MTSPTYFPIDRGVYEVAPGLKPFGADLGNPDFDKKVFQIDSHFSRFRENKQQAWSERKDKYVVERDFTDMQRQACAEWMLGRLREESPGLFQLTGERTLYCLHTGDRFQWDLNSEIKEFSSQSWKGSAPKNLLEALLLQVPEDFAVQSKDPSTGRDWLSYLNLCAASHWSPEVKIGMSFAQVHQPVPGAEKLILASSNLVDAMIHKGPFVRFVWSFVTDDRLNHHPVPPMGVDPIEWKGRSFNKGAKDPFILRVERQVTWGLPQHSLGLFTIRVSFIPGSVIRENQKWKDQLSSALQSMTAAAREYKGVAHCFDDLLSYLASPQ